MDEDLFEQLLCPHFSEHLMHVVKVVGKEIVVNLDEAMSYVDVGDDPLVTLKWYLMEANRVVVLVGESVLVKS